MANKDFVTLSKKNVIIGIIVIVIIILGVIVYLNLASIKDLMPSKAIATVNGIIIDQLVSRELLVQEANKRGITTDVKEAEYLLSTHLSQQGATIEDLKSRLNKKSDYDFIIKGYVEQISLGKLTDQLFENKKLEITDQESKEFFDKNQQLFNLVQSNGKHATYTDVKDQIKTLLKQQKQNKIIGELIDSLKNQSEIIYD